MAALTEDRDQTLQDGEFVSYAVKANTTIYGGSLVALDNTGYAIPGKTNGNLTYIGIASARVVNTGGNGDANVVVYRKRAGLFNNLTSDAVVQADVGKVCYIVDDQTVAKSHNSNARSAAGIVLAVTADGVVVAGQ